jgi:predicted molibdopterin-dependent oxidoreductase YjgC
VAKLTLNGVEVEAQEGDPLVEVIKRNGVWISNLCYIDGLVPYAGCRTCLVEIEGARGLQLSCTARVADGMVVNTETAEAKKQRQSILALINTNHPDRCLTCHRRVKCMPGDICLRDDVVTHRCVTCSKNYRCELQTTNELLDMGFENVEPWLLERRTWYQFDQPEPDRANPWFEFDPQMCILCTRCVRACDEIRHTSAITLANKGFTSVIAFGGGGPIHESNCDFCGACIDVCPTATLMEKPNKWIGRTEDWTSTTCNSCSVGCTISIGTRDGRAVIVKPDQVNPVSADQICVRGRFHYDSIAEKQRLRRHLVRRGPAGSAQFPAHWGELVEHVASRLKEIVAQHGVQSVAVLGSPINTNEENYLAQKLARDVIGTPHVDFSQAAANRAAMKAITAAFGTEALPADMLHLRNADVVIVIADDLESSHNVAALRTKDAIVGNPAAPRSGKLLVVSPIWGEMADFADPYGGAGLQPRPGAGPALVDALAKRVAGEQAQIDTSGDIDAATDVLALAKDPEKRVYVIYAPNPGDARAAGEGARAAANLAIALRGEKAAESLVVLPTEANCYGARDMGLDPELGPGRVALDQSGMTFDQMVDAAKAGTLKAIVVVGDNPLMYAPGTADVRAALEALDLLVVIDSLPTDTAKMAHAVFADVPSYAKTGTYVNGERRVNRVHAALAALGDARPALLALTDLANAIGGADTWPYVQPDDLTNEIAESVPG